MNEIVCATRGGAGSRAVQLAAIERARQLDLPLVFLYVASPGELGKESSKLHQAVRDELIWLGKALLGVAHDRARHEGLEAETVILVGDVQEEISRYLIEHEASVLMLGAPRGTTAELHGDDAVERFATRITQGSGVKVKIVRP